MAGYVLGLDEIDRTQVALAGGKGAHLGELSQVPGVRVPPGFCVTTDAFRRIVAEIPSIDAHLAELARLKLEHREAIRELSTRILRTLGGVAIPEDLAAAITGALGRLGEHGSYAVRSSATAEDMPTSSFAGQHDTYLNVRGAAAVVEHVRRCWASLFTERAVTYRLQNGLDHRHVHMAVVVQRLVDAQVSGVLFTADPVASNRKVASVEAVFGLGEALVTGTVNADAYTVCKGEVLARSVANKPLALHASPAGGTQQRAVEPQRQDEPALTDAQLLRLVELGRRIEAHFGHPQDIEWCLVDRDFHVVQSRPITTLFPVPEADDDATHVYVSVGHQQMMTDPMKPLGLSLWLLTTPAPMREAGGRLFVDVTHALTSPASRAGVIEALGRSDPLIGYALRTIVDRGDVVPTLPNADPGAPPTGGPAASIEADPAIVRDLIDRTQASIGDLELEIRTRTGPALLDFIEADIDGLKRLLFDPISHQVIMAGMEATWWLNEQLQAWLRERSVADTLTQSVPHNVTSQMGLALLDVADAIRPHREVVAFLERVGDEDRHGSFLDKLSELEGGPQSRDAIEAYLATYGMRCVGEIDITKPRWSERPTALVPMILSNIRNFEPGAGHRRFEEGRREALRRERDVLERLRTLPDGDRKADETKRMIDRVRTFIGYREYPKYAMVSRYFIYKLALLREAERLVEADVLREKEDIFFLTFDELHDVVVEQKADDQLIQQRKDALASYGAPTPPRVMTSDGEVFTGTYRRDEVPPGALVGLPVSAGTVEGRARVVLDMATADLESGDILVTACTDPSWTPAFVTIAGLVTEVGGLMTHGAVVAREYGLPAVVGVEDATRLIRDGQRIRVNGSDGYVDVLP